VLLVGHIGGFYSKLQRGGSVVCRIIIRQPANATTSINEVIFSEQENLSHRYLYI